MSTYIKLATLEFPRHEGDIRLEHPEILESQTGDTCPCPDTYAKVEWSDRPSFDSKTELVYTLPPKCIEGTWVMQWGVRKLTQEEIDYLSRTDTSMTFLNLPGEPPNVIG